jgi:uncharacterized protein YndB with AHSA1/START domain
MVGSHAANSATFAVTLPSDRVIRMTRLFSAPRQLVWEAMNRPEHVKRWWGILDERYSVPSCEIDFRPGGAWRFVGRGPQGEYAFHGVYREIDAPARVVFTEIFELFPDAESQVTAELTEEGGQTRLTVTAVYPSLEVRDSVVKSGMAKGAAISYDRLEDVVAGLPMPSSADRTNFAI